VRKANKSPTVPYSTVVREIENDPEFVSRTESPAKVNHV